MTDRADQAHEPDSRSDAELMERLAAGEREALAALVRRHQEHIYRLARRFLGSPEAAEDVAQDVFVRVLEHAGRYRPTAQFKTWLYRIVANRCWDLRRRARRARLGLVLQEPMPPASTPDPAKTERAERVRAAVAALPDRQRLALVLHRFGGLSHAEIASATGWSTRAVESCLVRAYDNLRHALADLGAE